MGHCLTCQRVSSLPVPQEYGAVLELRAAAQSLNLTVSDGSWQQEPHSENWQILRAYEQAVSAYRATWIKVDTMMHLRSVVNKGEVSLDCGGGARRIHSLYTHIHMPICVLLCFCECV